MKRHQHKIVTGLLILLLIGWMGRSHLRNLFPPSLKFYSQTLITLDGRQPIKLSDFKGKTLIVCCYQTWCTDCARETPGLNQLASHLDSTKFAVIYISDEDTLKEIAFRQRFASDKILFAHTSKNLSDFGITVFPTTYLLNKNGAVIKTKLEGYDWLAEEATIKKIIAE